jgi:uncharacterized membrane protein YfcA
LELSVATILLALAGVFLIAFMKGAFGGGFAIIGIPLLSIVMEPLTAGALLAPLFVAMDLCALRYWRPSTWSRPDLVRFDQRQLYKACYGLLLLTSLKLLWDGVSGYLK